MKLQRFIVFSFCENLQITSVKVLFPVELFRLKAAAYVVEYRVKTVEVLESMFHVFKVIVPDRTSRNS